MNKIDFTIIMTLDPSSWKSKSTHQLHDDTKNKITNLYVKYQKIFTYLEIFTPENNDERIIKICIQESNADELIKLGELANDFLKECPMIYELRVQPCTSNSDLFYEHYFKIEYENYKGRIPFSIINDSALNLKVEAFENYFFPELKKQLEEYAISAVLKDDSTILITRLEKN